MFPVKISLRAPWKRLRCLLCLAAIATMICGAFPAAAQQIYVAGDEQQFGTIDPTTGVYTPIGATPFIVNAMAFGADGTLYAADLLSDQLYTLDPATGAAALVGNMGFVAFGLAPASDGTLYGIDDNSDFFNIDPTTAASAFIGSTGFIGDGTLAGASSSNLYATQGVFGQGFYQIDPTTGAGTLLGVSSYGTVYGLAYVGGVMYALNNSGEIYSVDLSTGASTFVSNYDPVVGAVFASAAP